MCVNVFYARQPRFCSLIRVINLALPRSVNAIGENCASHIDGAAKSKEPNIGTIRKQRKCLKKKPNNLRKKKEENNNNVFHSAFDTKNKIT